MQQWIVPDCFLNILMFVCSRRRPQWTGWATGGSSSPGQGARVTEAKGKGERSGHGLQSQTQQVHGSGWAPEPRWGASMLFKGEGSGSVSVCISLGFCCGLSFGALDCMCTCLWNAGVLVSMLNSTVLWCLLPAGKGEGFERCVLEAESLLDQSLRLEQAGEVAAALSVVNEAMCK